MRGKPVGRVEDYTRTCLVLFFVNLLAFLTILWAAFGLAAALLAALALNYLIGWLERRRQGVR